MTSYEAGVSAAGRDGKLLEGLEAFSRMSRESDNDQSQEDGRKEHRTEHGRWREAAEKPVADGVESTDAKGNRQDQEEAFVTLGRCLMSPKWAVDELVARKKNGDRGRRTAGGRKERSDGLPAPSSGRKKHDRTDTGHRDSSAR